MSCSSCSDNNSFTSCGCSDNCPSKTSDITLFDGVLSSINVPVGSDLNDVLSLLELFVLENINGLNLTMDLLSTNCLGLPAGTYGIQQVINAIIDTLCASNDLVWINIPLINGWVSTLQPQYAIDYDKKLLYLRGEIQNIAFTSAESAFWTTTINTGDQVNTTVFNANAEKNTYLFLDNGRMLYGGSESIEFPDVYLFLQSIPVIRLQN